MRRFAFILCIITFACVFSACKDVNITSADELTAYRWCVLNQSGVSATLAFDKASGTAYMKITDQNGEEAQIKGVFAVDKNNFYITSEDLSKNYTFGYKVFKDRVLLTYNGITLEFRAEKEKEP